MNHVDRIRRIGECLDPHVIPPLQRILTDYLTAKDDRAHWAFRQRWCQFEVINESEALIRFECPHVDGAFPSMASFRAFEHPSALRFARCHGLPGFRIYRDGAMYLTSKRETIQIGTCQDFEAIKALLVRCDIVEWWQKGLFQ